MWSLLLDLLDCLEADAPRAVKLLQAPWLDENLWVLSVEENAALCKGAACPRNEGGAVSEEVCVLLGEGESK